VAGLIWALRHTWTLLLGFAAPMCVCMRVHVPARVRGAVFVIDWWCTVCMCVWARGRGITFVCRGVAAHVHEVE
jgi:hypothetical protein